MYFRAKWTEKKLALAKLRGEMLRAVVSFVA